MPVWGLTVQNEPMSTQRWESCIYTAAEERDFIKNYLGPALQKNNLGDKKLIAWDHNRDWMYQRASTLLNDAGAAKYIWGIGFHWYSQSQFDNVKLVAEAFPGKALMLTEGGNGDFNPQQMNEWKLGENYGLNMIHDFNNGAVAWTDWFCPGSCQHQKRNATIFRRLLLHWTFFKVHSTGCQKNYQFIEHSPTAYYCFFKYKRDNCSKSNEPY